MRALGWALILYDWYPYKKWEFEHRRHTGINEDDMKKHKEKMVFYKPGRGLEQILPFIRIHFFKKGRVSIHFLLNKRDIPSTPILLNHLL